MSINFDGGDIGDGINAHHFAFEGAAILEGDFHIFRIGDYVSISQQAAIGGYDKARSSTALDAIVLFGHLIAKKSPQNRIAKGLGNLTGNSPCRINPHHRWPDFFDRLGNEVFGVVAGSGGEVGALNVGDDAGTAAGQSGAVGSRVGQDETQPSSYGEQRGSDSQLFERQRHSDCVDLR